MASPIKKKKVSLHLSFPDAVRKVIEGYKITKEEWGNPMEYVFLKDGFLCIHHSGDDDGVFHRLLVSEGDLLGDDWMIITEGEYVKN